MQKTLWTTLILMLIGAPMALGLFKANREDVSIKDGKFSPAAVSIAVNDSVEWTNDDNRDHRIVAGDGSFDSGTIKPGKTFAVKFTKAGTFSYACTLHPREKGTIVVKK